MSITTGELALTQTGQEMLLPDTGVVWRVTNAADAYGGQTETWAAVGTADCRVAPTSGREAQIAAKLSALQTWTITLPHDTSITAADKIVSGGRTFQIMAVLSGGSWETARRCLCTEVL